MSYAPERGAERTKQAAAGQRGQPRCTGGNNLHTFAHHIDALMVSGDAVMFASGVSDAPEILPFAYNLVYTRPEVCKEKREMCARVGRAYAAAARMIQEQPQEVFDKILKKRFEKIDPQLLAAAWEINRRVHAKDVRITAQQFDHAQKVSAEAKLLDQRDTVKNYDGLFTDEFVK